MGQTLKLGKNFWCHRLDNSQDAAVNYYYDAQVLPTGAPTFDRGYAIGRTVAVTYGGITSTTGSYFGYDKMGQVLTHKQVTGSTTYSLNYTYNVAGEVLNETYPSSRVMKYAYDEAGRLAGVTDGTTATYANGFSYAPPGGLLSETFGNGGVHSMTYNRALQANQVKLTLGGTEQQRYDYSYGQVNQSTGSVDTSKNNGQIGKIAGYINGSMQWDQRFVYDSLGRLSTAAEYKQGNSSQLTWQAHYDYDRYGNRSQYQSNVNVGYIQVQSADIDQTRNRFVSQWYAPVSYDPAGNMTSDGKFRGMNYQYDAHSRMKQ